MGYGVKTVNSELIVINTFVKKETVSNRPTYMLGPEDRRNRFIHWPVRLAKVSEYRVSCKVKYLAKYIDVRDVTE